MPDYASFAALVFATFAGGIVCGFAGFAFSAVAGAILLHFFQPGLAIPLMMVCSITAQLGSMAYLRTTLQWKQSVAFLAGGALGVPLAITLLHLIDPNAFRRGFGLFLTAYSAYMLFRPKVVLVQSSGPVSGTAVGFAGGVVGGLTAMPGALPTIWCDLRGLPKEVQRGMVQPFIAAMQALAIFVLLLQPSKLPRELLGVALISLPSLALGTFIGLKFFGRVNDVAFRKAVLSLLFVSGLGLAI
jgi:uncharacterized membrane protein YfcA